MPNDILKELGYLALGSRLKRLAERLQASAAKTHADCGFSIQPGHFPLLAALDRYGPLSVGEAVEAVGMSQPGVTRVHRALEEMGLTMSETLDQDQRQKRLRLTAHGQAELARMKTDLWPYVRQAAEDLCAGPPADLLTHITRLEEAMDIKSLNDRCQEKRAVDQHALSIIDYDDAYAGDFYDITREWVEADFTLEAEDLAIIEHPRARIIDQGGEILFVAAESLGVVGTCALMPVGDEGAYELTKMGVRASARGLGAGGFLLDRVIDRARVMPAMKELFLLTNHTCEAAIYLYEKAGFVHDAGIMTRFGARYCRCDVAMSFDLGRRA